MFVHELHCGVHILEHCSEENVEKSALEDWRRGLLEFDVHQGEDVRDCLFDQRALEVVEHKLEKKSSLGGV